MGKMEYLHRFCNGIFIAALLVLSITAPRVVCGQSQDDGTANPPKLVDAEWLAAHLEDPDVVVIDARSPAHYKQGHIPGAVNLHSNLTYSSKVSRRLISQSRLQALLGRLGLLNGHELVIYCDENYLDSTRVLWVLELYGHSRIALLDGGYPAWSAAGRSVEAGQRERAPTDYRTAIRPGRMATRLQMRLAIDNPDIAIVDARRTEEYRGLESKAFRAGHIPTAVNYPSTLNLAEHEGIVYFKPVTTLSKLYSDLDGYSRIFLYCNGGRECESSLTYMALRLLGKPVSIYHGGWREWANDPDLPIILPDS